jgi:CheY-like chemotaxis protein
MLYPTRPVAVAWPDPQPYSSAVLQLGIQVQEAENGHEALQILKTCPRGHFSAIVLDIHMPIMNGWECIRGIREMEMDGFLPRMPVICCTSECLEQVTASHPGYTLFQHSLRSGFDECMVRLTAASVGSSVKQACCHGTAYTDCQALAGF